MSMFSLVRGDPLEHGELASPGRFEEVALVGDLLDLDEVEDLLHHATERGRVRDDHHGPRPTQAEAP